MQTTPTIPAGVGKIKARCAADAISDALLVSYWATDADRANYHDKEALVKVEELAALFGCKLVQADEPVQVAA